MASSEGKQFEEPEAGEDEVEEVQEDKAARARSGAADLDKITEFIEDKAVESTDFNAAALALIEKRKKEIDAKHQKVKEGASRVSGEDVSVLADLFDLPRALAETRLAAADGDLKTALRASLAL